MQDEGYVKYRCTWIQGPSPGLALVQYLNPWRDLMYQHHLIGWSAQDQVGFGNISLRSPEADTLFIISGTQTGRIVSLEPRHYTRVTAADIPANALTCVGAVAASSESLTHAAVYQLDKRWQAVIHVHHAALWTHLYGQIPTTDPDVPYGTPEMAAEITRLYHSTDLPARKLLVMGGHQDGLIAFGETPEAAARCLLDALQLISYLHDCQPGDADSGNPEGPAGV